MKLKPPVVVLFGAGATRGGLANSRVPPPLDADFFDVSGRVRGHGTPRLAKVVLKDVWALYKKTSGVGLEAFYRDIETRETIGTFAKTKYKPKDWQKRRRNLEELIRRVAIQTTCDTTHIPHTAIRSQLHLKILKKLHDGDTILTFNYDTTIEESFDSADLWSPVDGYGPNVYGHSLDWGKKWFASRHAARDQQTKVLLLKLHGSVNWVLDKTNKVRLKPRPYVVRTMRGRPSFEKISILPPGWYKRIDKNPYKQFWRLARRKLEQCESLVIIGYSLPETDLLARALFSEAVRSREARSERLKQLHIADPNDGVVRKLVDLFTPALGAHGLIFKYTGIEDLTNRLGTP
jgi:hypothetical protein